MSIQSTKSEPEEKSPFLGSWRNIYLLVIGNLVVLILIFYLLTTIYS